MAVTVFLIVGGLIAWLTHLTRTARLRTDRAEHREQTVLDSITDAFVAVDFGWRFTYVNEGAQVYFGMSERELIGRVCWEVFPQAIGTPLESYYRQVMEGREAIRVELPSIIKDTRWAQLHIAPTAEGISVVFRDITEQRRLQDSILRHQERLHRALEAAGMAAWEYDPRLDRVTYSASASDVLGVPADRLPHDRHTGTEIIHPDDREAYLAIVRRAARTADGQYRSQYRLAEAYLFGRHGPVWIEDRGRMLFDAVGVLTLVQGVVQDVTADRATEEHIRALNEHLQDGIAERQTLLEVAEASRESAERSSRAKDEFLAVLSHELRSPMQSVLGWVQVLRTTPLESETSGRALDTIERNLRQQTQLINDMLDVSRIVTGKLVFHLVTLPLASVVRETVDELRPQADVKGLDLELHVQDDLFVVADRERVRQVVSNLFANAVKFTAPGGRIRVTCGERDGMARLEVTDTGDGIAPMLLPTIFERFRQADTSSTRPHEGLGLGLSITKYIVDHLGGSIAAESGGPGMGSCFSVRLPLAGVRREEGVGLTRTDLVDDESPVVSAPADRRLVALDVMVVDDHRDTVDLIAFVLTREGAEVRTALSAQEALAAWLQRPADVLVTDLSMPGMDGFGLLAAVSRDADVKAIALSGLARADDRQRALQAGFVAHLAKPVEPRLLVETLARLQDDRLMAAREFPRP
ncbi:ATP-binding protein [Luteitalea pratensis]|uniref:PAS domain-containing hybrid sensor histidine kinase/response regulator n=1 Tax=Luteitalea pratensis TaxID=1855912 RepID=UPI00139060DE|nr:ATP-binding protein [Luteitalea pratensis]